MAKMEERNVSLGVRVAIAVCLPAAPAPDADPGRAAPPESLDRVGPLTWLLHALGQVSPSAEVLPLWASILGRLAPDSETMSVYEYVHS